MDKREGGNGSMLGSPLNTLSGSTLLFPVGKSKHWLVLMDKSTIGVVTKAQIVDYYTQLLTKVMGTSGPNNLQPTIVSLSWDRTVKIWNLTNCKIRASLAGHSGYGNTVAVSLDGSLCASGEKDGVILLWDLAEGKKLYSLDSGSIINALCFSPNRYWLCAATEASIKIWDLESKTIDVDFKVDAKQEAEMNEGGAAVSLSAVWKERPEDTDLQSSVAATRNATIKLIGALHKFVGPDIKGFLSDVKPALLSALEAECEKKPFEDKSVDVRKAAEVCIGEIFRVCGPDTVTKNLKDIQGPALAIVLERLKHSGAFQETFEVAKTISMGPSLKSGSKVGKSSSNGNGDRRAGNRRVTSTKGSRPESIIFFCNVLCFGWRDYYLITMLVADEVNVVIEYIKGCVLFYKRESCSSVDSGVAHRKDNSEVKTGWKRHIEVGSIRRGFAR
ncbi:hypothetical protein HYC85_026914 [Camellia sinensis]|uniref:MORF/ORRM1/DAG-like MORF domain-containing protein n=1 Tax=Camellia sinensis TaxID=4442 RepID=A0A7J7G656_CAMSI|nr:hypothetical protein HYC85_026914 [Camellia sinensis]